MPQWLRVVKSFRGPRLDSQHQRGGSQPSLAPVSGHLMPSSDFCGHQIHTWYMHTGKTLIHIKQTNKQGTLGKESNGRVSDLWSWLWGAHVSPSQASSLTGLLSLDFSKEPKPAQRLQPAKLDARRINEWTEPLLYLFYPELWKWRHCPPQTCHQLKEETPFRSLCPPLRSLCPSLSMRVLDPARLHIYSPLWCRWRVYRVEVYAGLIWY